VGRLGEIQRAVVTLRMLDELPGDDVARALGLKPGHVAVLLHRAKASLRDCMTEDSADNIEEATIGA
jgi:RNA polymerase sigma-70 factor (ECF subfamily)